VERFRRVWLKIVSVCLQQPWIGWLSADVLRQWAFNVRSENSFSRRSILLKRVLQPSSGFQRLGISHVIYGVVYLCTAYKSFVIFLCSCISLAAVGSNERCRLCWFHSLRQSLERNMWSVIPNDRLFCVRRLLLHMQNMALCWRATHELIRKPSLEVAPTTLAQRTRQTENTCRSLYLLTVSNSGLLLSRLIT